MIEEEKRNLEKEKEDVEKKQYATKK